MGLSGNYLYIHYYFNEFSVNNLFAINNPEEGWVALHFILCANGLVLSAVQLPNGNRFIMFKGLS